MKSIFTYFQASQWRVRALALATAALAVVFLELAAPRVLHMAEDVAGDVVWRATASQAPERRVVIVDIDEASLARHGAWPWPRATLADLSRRLSEAGAVVQVMDLVLDAARPGDAELKAVWQTAPVVLGQIFSLDPDTRPRVGEPIGALTEATDPRSSVGSCPDFAPVSQGYIANSASLLPSGHVAGHLTPRVLADGVVREIPALICHDGRLYPTLAMAALWRAAQPDEAAAGASEWQWRAGQGLLEPSFVLSSPSLPGLSVPVSAGGYIRVPFRAARHALTSVSAHEVLSGQVAPDLLAGAIALVGATAFGIGDVVSTPLAPVASGVEVHAQLMAGMLDNRIPATPRWVAAWQALAMLLIAGLLWLVAVRPWGAPAKRLPLAGAALAGLCLVGAAVSLSVAGYWLPWAGAALYALLGSTALATAEHAFARAQRARLSAHLEAYLPAPVASKLMRSDPTGALQVHRRPVSVLVADIRNFSAFAQHRPPEETAALLHAFYCIAVDVVELQGGVVEQIAGDSVLAVWNAYADMSDHPALALKAAKNLLLETRELLSRPIGTDHGHRVQPLALGVGLECGLAVVGSFGPERRRSHAALGEPVSVASRLQKMTQDLSMPLLIGPQMAKQLPEGSTEVLGDYLLEGLDSAYTLHSAIDAAELLSGHRLGVPRAPDAAADDANEPWLQRSAHGSRPARANGPPPIPNLPTSQLRSSGA